MLPPIYAPSPTLSNVPQATNVITWPLNQINIMIFKV